MSPMPFGVHRFSDANAQGNFIVAAKVTNAFRRSPLLRHNHSTLGSVLRTQSPMPFGVHRFSDPSSTTQPVRHAKSPMPFGVHRFSDQDRSCCCSSTLHQSPMPFGVHRFSDILGPMWNGCYLGCHQCLSAFTASPTEGEPAQTHHDTPVTNAFRRSPLLRLQRFAISSRHATCHQCLSAFTASPTLPCGEPLILRVMRIVEVKPLVFRAYPSLG